MSEEELDKHFPKLSEIELAIALDACKRAGAVNAANALGKYVTRLQIEVDLLKKELEKRG
jgi:hypothetical protein